MTFRFAVAAFGTAVCWWAHEALSGVPRVAAVVAAMVICIGAGLRHSRR